MNILAFTASPRYGGNTETLLDAVISGMKSEGATVEKYRLHELDITPCKSCGNCEKEFRCPINDTFQDFIEPIIACDGIVFASPLYFMNVPAQGKAFIDRCQLFWSARYLLGMKLFGNKNRFGMLISCGGRSYGPGKTSLFRGIEDTMSYFFYALGLKINDPVLFKKVDSKGAISELDDAVEQAHKRGRMIVKAMSI